MRWPCMTVAALPENSVYKSTDVQSTHFSYFAGSFLSSSVACSCDTGSGDEYHGACHTASLSVSDS